MRFMVIDPRGRLRRSRFLWDLILPNIGAAIAIVLLRNLENPLTDLAVGAIAVLLVWSANFAAPIARLHDLGLPAALHFVVVAVVFLFGTIGPVGSIDELALRITDWMTHLGSSGGTAPQVTGDSARVAGLIALVQVFVLAFVAGNKGANRYGPDPKDKR